MCSLLLHLDHCVVLMEHSVALPHQFSLLSFKGLVLKLLFLKNNVLLFVFEFKAIQVVDQMGVFLGLDAIFDADSSLILASVCSKCVDGTLHVVQLLVEFFDGFRVTLLSLVLVGHLALHVVLVEFHEASDVGLVILELYDLLHVLCKLQDDRLLLLSLFFLLRDFNLNLSHLGLMLPQFLAVVSDLRILILKVLLQLEQLILQVVNLLLLWLQALAHFLRSVCQDVLRLP